MKRVLVLVGLIALLAGSLPATTLAAPRSSAARSAPADAAPPVKKTKPAAVLTARDEAKAKLDSSLQEQLDSGSNASIYVFVNVVGSPKEAEALLAGDHTATSKNGATSLVVGRIRVQQLVKLAGLANIIAVNEVSLAKTGAPLGDPDPDVPRNPNNTALKGVFKQLRANEVPYAAAPPLRTSNFEALKELALLDAKTHNFAQAWQAGYTGEGSVVSVLDGGTDWGHPDLLNTWQVNATSGWPNAYDPFGALVLAVQSTDDSLGTNVNLGLTWYTPTEAKTYTQTVQDKQKGIGRVSYAVRRGPSRNFGAPDAKVTNSYSFPVAWTKSGTVRIGGHPDDHLLAVFGERAAFLVTDPNTAGVYDTVYVDLDNDHSFIDEKPVTKGSPAAYRDMNGDGLIDVSGGLLYYISTGKGAGGAVLPGGPTDFGIEIKADPGALLAWTGDFDPAIEGHGTLTASNVVGQGVINGLAPTFADVPGGRPPGMVIGGAPRAKLAPFGDIYFGFDFSTQFGYLLAAEDGTINVTSNSYGNSDDDNDGFDAASQEADIILAAASDGKVLDIGSTGNGAPGYGTVNSPAPVFGMRVGASTQFGGTGWDSIRNHAQIRDNDVIGWSDRGPQSTGANGVDIVADGAYSAGDATTNTVFNGNTAWTTWGGTSRSTPVAAGAAALVYQAWRQAHGAIPAGFQTRARDILKSSARDLGYDSFTQGAGSLDAFAAVQLAAGQAGAGITPSAWRAGDYRGREFPVFPNLMVPGGTDSQAFTLDGAGTYSLSDRMFTRTDSETFSFTTAPISKESTPNFNVPDYLIDITQMVKDHPSAAMIAISANFNLDEFDVDHDYSYDQRWRLLAYDWTDMNGDGNLWTDKDGDGAVDHKEFNSSSTIDGDLDVKWDASEIDRYEYERFSYTSAASDSQRIHVGDPAQRMTDGIFIGLQHPEKTSAVPVTHLSIRVDFYENVDWSWITTPASGSGSFTANLHVPEGTAPGMYEGAIVASKDGHDTVIPVSVIVAGQPTQAADGTLTGSLTFGGADVAEDQSNLAYNNGAVFGANDWNWRAESGDWRFFYLDVPATPPAGSLFLVDTSWDDAAPYTDLDTLVFGRSANTYQLFGGSAPIGAPYILDTVGKSPNRNIGAGVWEFDTATGGASDLVAARAQAGLHAVVAHQVQWQSDKFTTPFQMTVGSATVNPSSVVQATTSDTGAFDVTFKASVDLPGLAADAFGLSQPVVTTETAHQDDPNDPSTASVKKSFTLDHAARATISTQLADDLDLYIVYDENNDGTFESSEIIASSAGGTGNESVTLVAPADGNYQAWVHGFAVAGTPTFPLAINAVQGNDLTVTGLPAGAVPAGTAVVIHVAFSKTMTAGQSYFGELQLGPPAAPAALSVPIRINRN